MRTCRECGLEKEDTAFCQVHPGVRRRICETCRRGKKRARRPDFDRQKRIRHQQRNLGAVILKDSKHSDKKKGRLGNDLDREFIDSIIKDGCKYCGEKLLRMTLDRIDNSLAHTKSNVIPCCIRCNYIRGSMPYAAWVEIVPAVKVAKKKGLFGTWRATPMVVSND